MSTGVSAKHRSIAIGGDVTGTLVNAEQALLLNVKVEQQISRELPSFLGRLILTFSEEGLAEYGKGARRSLPPEVSDKIKYNYLPSDHHIIQEYRQYVLLLEKAYHGVEQRNADARYLVRRKAEIAYEAEVQLEDRDAAPRRISKLEHVRLNAVRIVENVIKRLLDDYKLSGDIKVEEEIAHLAVSLVVADAIVECQVLESP
jgi:hypothetical protein